MIVRLYTGLAAIAVLQVPAGAQRAPTAQQVLDRHEAAIGGRAALEKHSTMRITTTFSANDSVLARFEIVYGKPFRYAETLRLSDGKVVRRGYDDGIAWTVGEAGAEIFTDEDAEAMKRSADWFREFSVPQAMRGAHVDSAEFEGKRAWRLTYALTIGLDVATFYDRITGLKLGETRATPAGEVTRSWGEYKSFDGFKVATRVVVHSIDGEFVTATDSVQFDKVDPKALAVPPEVRALIRKGE